MTGDTKRKVGGAVGAGLVSVALVIALTDANTTVEVVINIFFLVVTALLALQMIGVITWPARLVWRRRR